MSQSGEGNNPALPQVAVALACRNGAHYIRQQVLSILWQVGCDTHIYVRDDGSTDETVSILEDLAQSHPGCITIVDDAVGPSGSAAQNFFLLLMAIASHRLDYVALADQDDIWEAQKLVRAISELDRAGADGYSSNLNAFSVDGTAPTLVRKDHPESAFDYLFQTASAGCTYVLSARLFACVAERLDRQGSHPDVAHDILIYAIARSHGFRWTKDRQAHILYRQHSQNLVGSRSGIAGLLARWKQNQSGWYRAQTRMLEPYLAGSAAEDRILRAVTRAGPFDRLWLAVNALRFRRRVRESLAFAFLQFTK